MKKLLALLIVFTFVLSFASCSSDSTTLKVATNAEFEPWEYLDENQQPTGFDIDLMKAIGEKIGMEIKFSDMKFESVVASIPSGTCDVAISGLTINATRQKSVDFSTPYYSGASQILIVKNDDTVFTGTTKEELDEQLKGKTIGVCKNFTGEAYANGDEDWGFTKVENATVKSYDSIGLAIADMKNGNIDVIIMDDTPAKEAANGDEAIKVVDVPLTTESYGIAIKKDNTELKEKIDNAIQQLFDDGTIDDLLAKWKLD